MKDFPGGFIILWVFGVLVNLAFWGFLLWLAYRLVMHITG